MDGAAVAGAVVGEDLLDDDAVACEEGCCAAKEAGRREGALIGEHLGVGQAAVAAGKISWTGTTVRDALTMTAYLTSGLAGGLGSLSSTDYAAAVKKVFGTPARAVVPGGSAALTVLYSAKAVRPLSQFGAFAFPRINGDAPRVIGDADVVVMTKASTAAQALVTYLASPEAATIWAKRGGFYLSPNRGVAPNSYGDPAIRSLATTLAAANVFRLGLADLMPASLTTTFERMLVQYVRDPAAAGALLTQLNAGS